MPPRHDKGREMKLVLKNSQPGNRLICGEMFLLGFDADGTVRNYWSLPPRIQWAGKTAGGQQVGFSTTPDTTR